MKNKLAAALFTAMTLPLIWSEAALAFGKPEHSLVKAKAATGDQGQLNFEFKVEPNKDMQVTLDAPWQLKVSGHQGLVFEKTTLKKADLDEALPGFKLAASGKPTVANGSVDFQLTAFICTQDKTRCYREVHKGRVPWAVAAKP